MQLFTVSGKNHVRSQRKLEQMRECACQHCEVHHILQRQDTTTTIQLQYAKTRIRILGLTVVRVWAAAWRLISMRQMPDDVNAGIDYCCMACDMLTHPLTRNLACFGWLVWLAAWLAGWFDWLARGLVASSVVLLEVISLLLPTHSLCHCCCCCCRRQ